MKTQIRALVLIGIVSCTFASCDAPKHAGSSDATQQEQQERILAEGNSKTGMPGIVNFREKKLLKMILELRDQEGLTTFTYLENLQSVVVPGKTALAGKFTFLGESIGYGIPYATQYTNPQKIAEKNTYQSGSYAILPQADPNGLFSPASAEGTWVMLKDPNSKDVQPVYIEPRIVVSPFKFKMD